MQQRAPNLPDGEIERDGVEQRPGILGGEPTSGAVVWNRRVTLACVTMTPLGWPVEPDV